MTKTFKVITANWDKHKAILQAIRKAVFIDEQSVPVELEWDEFDKTCTHFLVTENDIPVGTGRIKQDGQIGRMAVLKVHRQLGAGSMLLDYILQYGKEHGHKKVFCNAQVAVIDFYLKKGFEKIGDEFSDANIPHQAMFKKICY